MSLYRVMEIKCLHANCWGARCTACGAWLTKHDWDAEEAARNAEDAFTRKDQWQHICPKQDQQLTLEIPKRGEAAS